MSKERNDGLIHIQAQSVYPRPESSRRMFSKYTNLNRYNAYEYCFKYVKGGGYIPEESINTRKKLASFVKSTWSYGVWGVCFRGHKKNKFGSSPIQRAIITIFETDDPDELKYDYIKDELYKLRWIWGAKEDEED